MCQVLNLSGFWIFQDCQNVRVLNFQGYTGFNYFRECDDKVQNMCSSAIMEGFWIFQDSNLPDFCICKRYTSFWVWLNNAWTSCSEYAWDRNTARLWKCEGYKGFRISLNSFEYARILNLCDAVHGIRSLNKLLGCYWDRGVFRALWNIEDAAFCKSSNAWVQVRNQKLSGQGSFCANILSKTREKKSLQGNQVIYTRYS